MMSDFIFTPQQREEAKKWYLENADYVFQMPNQEQILDFLVDIYFKLKSIPFSFKPNEFIVGIEYKNEAKVRIGKEAPNIHINNPHKKIGGQETHDQFALVFLFSLFKNNQI